MTRFPRTLALALLALASCLVPAGRAERFQVRRTNDAVVVVGPEGRETLRYQLVRPSNAAYAAESACYFHPFATPSGRVVTEMAPGDHPHHRGIFLGFVETHGARDADFWGWGAHAPRTNRAVLNREVRNLTSTTHGARFVADNEWRADGMVVVRERLDVRVSRQGTANILDLAFTLTPVTDTTLSRWAFGGFAVRLRKDASITAFAPEGPADFPAPVHTNPEANWPYRPWYAYRLGFNDGPAAFVGVRSGDRNPPTTWHNALSIALINPAITAPAAVVLRPSQPLELRYRVVAADDALPPHVLD